MTPKFDITPEKRAGFLAFLYRQLFVTPPPVSHDIDLSGKTAIVTGANVGLGLATATQILALGGNVILAVRDERKGETARQNLLAAHRDLSPAAIQVWNLDLASYSSITAFAERTRTLPSLDIAILNAGIIKMAETFSPATGYEEMVQINYLATMLLAVLLLPVLKEKKSGPGPARLCVVSSDVAAWTNFAERTSNPLLPAFKQKSPTFSSGDRYGTTKLLGQLFLTELAKRVDPSSVVVDWANPGLCRSDFGRDMSGPMMVMMSIQTALLARTGEVGARTLVHAVTTLGREAHGQYVEDAKIQP